MVVFAAAVDVEAAVEAEAAGAALTVAGFAGLGGVASAVDFAGGALAAGEVAGANHSLMP